MTSKTFNQRLVAVIVGIRCTSADISKRHRDIPSVIPYKRLTLHIWRPVWGLPPQKRMFHYTALWPLMLSSGIYPPTLLFFGRLFYFKTVYLEQNFLIRLERTLG